jgi:ornithine carbamoyltransferase
MDLSKSELNTLIQRAITLKKSWKENISYTPLQQRTLAMIFDKASTRTRVSFETGMTQL